MSDGVIEQTVENLFKNEDLAKKDSKSSITSQMLKKIELMNDKISGTISEVDDSEELCASDDDSDVSKGTGSPDTITNKSSSHKLQ